MKYFSNPLLWLLLAFTLYFLGLGAVGFVGPDEPRYADVARGMLRTGDYVTPRLFGEPWFEKPPLYYWLAALFFRMGGSEIEARLPSAIAAIAFLVVWYKFTRRRFGERRAILACVLLGSTLGWIGFAHAAVMDMLFAAALGTALILLASWFWNKEEQTLWAFYAVLGLATLAKGPVAVVLAGLIALAYLLTYGDWKTLKATLLSPGPAFFLLVAGPWYAVCYQRNGMAFVQEFIIKHNFERYISLELGHGQPVWFYFPVVMAGLFPWTPLLLLPLAEVILRGPRAIFADREKIFLFYWAAIVFLFFSFSQNKLPSYVLPLLPPVTLWIAMIIEGESPARAAERAKKIEQATRSAKRSGRPSAQHSEAAEDPAVSVDGTGEESPEALALARLALWLIGLSGLLLFAVPLAASILGDSLATGLRQALAASNGVHLRTALLKGPIPPPALLLLFVPVGFCFYMLWRRDLLEAAFLVLTGVALCMIGMVEYVSPAVNRVASVRNVAQRLQVLEIEGDQVAVSDIRRDQSLGLSYYLDRALPDWDPRTSPASINYVIARDGDRVQEARPTIFFPGSHLRLWALPPSQFEIQVVPEPGKSSGK
jgi:dolichyl-phosphate-mannose-protein mannosyltransferase